MALFCSNSGSRFFSTRAVEVTVQNPIFMRRILELIKDIFVIGLWFICSIPFYVRWVVRWYGIPIGGAFQAIGALCWLWAFLRVKAECPDVSFREFFLKPDDLLIECVNNHSFSVGPLIAAWVISFVGVGIFLDGLSAFLMRRTARKILKAMDT